MKSWIGRNQSSRMTLEERFWEKVDRHGDNDCWNWLAGCNNSGYGTMGIRKEGKHTSEVSNRLAWNLTYGEIPTDLCVLHHCDNRRCCNPKHLFLGTRTDNNKDRHAKNRDAFMKGTTNPRTKLTEDDIREIRRLYATRQYSIRKLAKRYKMGRSPINRIVNREAWSHIK